MVGEVDLRLLHQISEREQEPGPQGPHVKPFEFPYAMDREMATRAILVPMQSAERILWANDADYRYGAPNLLLIQTRHQIDVDAFKKTHEIDPDFDITKTFQIKPLGGGRLARMIAPNRIAIASNQKNMDAFLEFQTQPAGTRQSATDFFSDPNFVLRFVQRKPPGQEAQELPEEVVANDPILKLLAPLDRTLNQFVFQASFADDHSFALKLQGTFTSPEAAKDASIKYKMGKAMLDQFYELYLEDTELPRTAYPLTVDTWPHMVSILKQLLENAQAHVNGSQCTIETQCNPELYETLVATVKRMPEQSARINDQFRLQRILSALSLYHTFHGHYPPSIILDEESGHVRSWRVEMLKYMEDDDLKELYEKYRQDEPWDSAANLKFLDASVSAFSSSWETDPHAASFFYVLGEGTPLQDEEATRDQIKDPRGETVLIVSADRDIPWTMPADLNFEEALDLNELGIWDNGLVLVGTADLSPILLLSDFSPESWRSMLLKADGKKVKLPPEPYRPIKRAKR
ncbi:DUF1559 domain-containing protein [Blastopirellula marina]|uniref:DUF1559 domain-containing protein n=1 Tax=Blastopirellula marina TaxID=124 RepID=A0A2S8F9D2_9BACT|nr:DUF1559 domain-containing protein [Blastopirellula marina]PQO28745.1 hypothetical protein C5Y98_23475 [Blastopirellula marina]PTL42018.1 DUF1559 domain-containing protein [Blastopirellula marina]